MNNATTLDQSSAIGAEDLQALGGWLNDELTDGLDTCIVSLDSHADLVASVLRTGHRTRPLACLLACRAAGGRSVDALGVAVGIECIHKASVIRDDIADVDDQRNGEACLHVVHGVSVALAVSDVLLGLGLEYITRVASNRGSIDLVERCNRTVATMARGQLEDLQPSGRAMSTRARLAVDEDKTGALAEFACAAGALIGGGTARQVSALAAYGRHVGTAFQVLNTVRNVRGEEPGRPAATDVRKRRDTVLTAWLREETGVDVRSPGGASASRDGDLPDARFHEITTALASVDAVGFAEGLAHRLLAEARAELEGLDATPARRLLEKLAASELLAIYAF